MRKLLLVLAVVGELLLAPSTASAQSTVDVIVGTLDAFWAQSFAAAGLPYESPRIVAIDGPMTTACGDISPDFGPGAYCAADQTIYYSTAWSPNDPGAEILWWTVLGHEWAHHIQWLTDTGVSTVFDAEQQADCFSGAFLNYAKDAGLLSPLAVTLATGVTQSAGDVWFEVPPDSPEHGNKAERPEAFMSGVNGGVGACGFPV
jgi:predicted metalloprotease